MTWSDDPITVLSRALDQAGDVIAGAAPDRSADPTPCPGWDVATLIGHLTEGARRFRLRLLDQPEPSEEPAATGRRWSDDFRAAADDLLHAWHRAEQSGAEPSAPPPDWQTAEIAVHTWDLARATGWSAELDPQVGERALAFLESSLKPEHRGPQPGGMTVFGPAVDVPPDAPVYDRLAAFAGRDPHWPRPG